jgi:hypothetical protein
MAVLSTLTELPVEEHNFEITHCQGRRMPNTRRYEQRKLLLITAEDIACISMRLLPVAETAYLASIAIACFGWILSKRTPSFIKSKVLNMSSVFRTKTLQDTGIDVFWSHRLQRRLLSDSSLQVPHSHGFLDGRCIETLENNV